MRGRFFVLALAFTTLTAVSCTTLEKEEKEAEKEEKVLEKQAAPFLGSCRAEAQKICKAAGGNNEKLAACLKANKDKVGAACKNAIEQAVRKK